MQQKAGTAPKAGRRRAPGGQGPAAGARNISAGVLDGRTRPQQQQEQQQQPSTAAGTLADAAGNGEGPTPAPTAASSTPAATMATTTTAEPASFSERKGIVLNQVRSIPMVQSLDTLRSDRLTPRRNTLQLLLSEAELKEDVPRMLTASDPQVPASSVRYSYRDKAFKQEPPGAADSLAVHFALEGAMLHKVSRNGDTLGCQENPSHEMIHRLIDSFFFLSFFFLGNSILLTLH